MLEVLKIGEKHYLEAIKLSEYAFQYIVPEEQIEKRFEKLKKNQLFGILEDEQLVAKLQLLSFEIFLGDKKWKMGGIAGVATYPEYRRRGFVKELVKNVLETMKLEGYTVSMLHPFSIAFYRKYGWEILSNRHKCYLSKADLVMHESVDGSIKRFSKNTHSVVLEKIYEQYARRFSGMLARDVDWWESVYSDHYGAIYYDQSKDPTGYMLYTIKDSKMVVKEFIPLNGEARSGLWNFICQHDSMLNEVEITIHERDPLLFSLKNPQVKMEVSPYFMVRIVDAQNFLQQYNFNWRENPDGVVLQITDPYAPWNEKTFLLKDNYVTIITNDSIPKEKIIKLSINALSTTLFGYKRPLELYQIGMLTGNEEEINTFENFISCQQPFFYDYF